MTPREKAQQRQREILAEERRLKHEEEMRKESLAGVPYGFSKVDLVAYTNGHHVIVTDEGGIDWMDPEGREDDHDCDAMGCGWSHVLARFELPRAKENT